MNLVKIFIWALGAMGAYFVAYLGMNTDAGMYPLGASIFCIFVLLYLVERLLRQDRVSFIKGLLQGAMFGGLFMTGVLILMSAFWKPGDKMGIIAPFLIACGAAIGGSSAVPIHFMTRETKQSLGPPNQAL